MAISNHKTFMDKVRKFVDIAYSIDYLKYAKPIAIIFFSLTFFFALIIDTFKTTTKDFYAYYTAAHLLIHDRPNLYNPDTQAKTQDAFFQRGWNPDKGFMAFINLPLSAVIYIPSLLIPPLIAAELAHLMTLLVILYCIVRLYRFHKIKVISATTLVVTIFLPSYLAVHLGQIGIIILFLLTEMYISFMEKRFLRLGLLSSLLVFKYQYVILIPLIFALSEDKKNFLKGAVPALLLILSGNYLLTTPVVIQQYIDLIKMYYIHPTKFGMQYNYCIDLLSTISEFTKDTNIHDKIPLIVTSFLAVSHIVTFVVLLTKKHIYKLGSDIFYFCIIYSLIMSPHTGPADFVFLLVVVIGIFPRIKRKVFYAISLFILNIFFYFSVFEMQWAHTFPMIFYALLLLSATLKNPGKVGRWVQKSMVGDPGFEPGTARV